MTKNAEYRRNERQAKKERGLVRVELWVYEHQKVVFKRLEYLAIYLHAKFDKLAKLINKEGE